MNTELEIIISAVDEASAAFGEINDSLAGVSTAAATMVDSTTASFDAFMASVSAAAAATGLDETEIMAQMEATGLTAQEVATEIITANEEIDASNDLTKGSFMPIAAAAALAFGGVASAVSSSISSAETWNTTSATIAQILKDTGSSIPLSQIQAYAQQVQSTTLFTQQSALSAEEQIVSHKQLQGSYQSLTVLTADLATKMNTDMPSAAQLLTSALSDPVSALNKLVKAGIDFNAQQVTQIENMAKVGNNAGASAAIIEDLQGTIGGAAAAAANAPGAALTQLSNQFAALGTTIANSGIINQLNAIALAIIPIIQQVGQWATEHPKLTEAIVLGTLAFTAFLAAAALIGIIIGAVGSSVALAMVVISAAIAGFIAFVVPNWKTFWDGFMDVVNVATQIVAGTIELALNLILAAVYLFSNAITGTLNIMADLIKTITNALFASQEQLFKTGLDDITNIWTTSLNGLETIATNVWNAIGATFKTGIDYVISAINGFINALDAIHISLPSISIPGTKLSTPAVNLGFSIPDIPMLAAGGFVTSPTLAIIGEAGPEAVIPLSSGMAGGVGGGQQIVININGGIFPADDSTMKQIGNLLAKQILRGLRPVSSYAP